MHELIEGVQHYFLIDTEDKTQPAAGNSSFTCNWCDSCASCGGHAAETAIDGQFIINM